MTEEFDDGLFGLVASREALPLQQFLGQGSEEAFHHGVVPAVSFAAHAANDAVAREQVLEIVAGVLAAAVAVMQPTGLRSSRG